MQRSTARKATLHSAKRRCCGARKATLHSTKRRCCGARKATLHSAKRQCCGARKATLHSAKWRCCGARKGSVLEQEKTLLLGECCTATVQSEKRFRARNRFRARKVRLQSEKKAALRSEKSLQSEKGEVSEREKGRLLERVTGFAWRNLGRAPDVPVVELHQQEAGPDTCAVRRRAWPSAGLCHAFAAALPLFTSK